MKNPSRILFLVALAIILTLIVGRTVVGFYTDALWFRHAGFASVFWTRFTTEIVARTVAAVLAALVVLGNLWLVTRQLGPVHVRRRYGNLEISEQIPRHLVNVGMLVVSALAGWWLSGVKFGGHMPLALLTWLKKVPWGATDPLFGNDLSFYAFTLPVYYQIVEYVMLIALWSLVLSVLGYAVVGSIRWLGNRLEIDKNARIHALLLLALLLIVIGVRVWIGRYSILVEGTGLNGAVGYTDVHARLPAQRIIAILCALTGGALIFSAIRRVWAPTILGAALILLASIGGEIVYPGFVQKFRVDPNELRFEEQYIKWNIDFTRRAYGLSDVARQTYAYRRVSGEPTELAARLDEVPLWDVEPLHTAYNQLQAFFPYYHFPNVDYDRYGTPDGGRQVAIAVREFLPTGLSENARTWQNVHFDPKYIRGIGVTVTPAAVMGVGEPPTWVKNVNPVERAEDAPPQLELTESSIFFGETMDDYIVIRKEAGLPTPTTAIPLNLMRVIAFAWRFADNNLLFTGGLTGSHMAFRRRVSDRVRELAPFIIWDSDPYPVVSDGHVIWMIDGYSATRMFPISRPVDVDGVGQIRYLRNTVKATVDAASGEVRMYRFVENDPLLETYANAFPALFRPGTEMPADLQQHVRYPTMLMHEQAEIFGQYHLSNADAFYRGEDVWQMPRTTDASSRTPQQFRAVYQMMTLPGETEREFVLPVPYIARQRQNMTAMLIARNDPPHYGELILLELPRNQLIPGPGQIEAIVEQDPVISQQLSLWRQAGSDVNIGHVRVVPVGSGFLYVMPLFLSAQGSPIPELQRIIVSDGTRVAMANTLREAVSAVFGTTTPAPGPAAARPATPTAPAAMPAPAEWPKRALELLDQAERALRAGDYAGFGARMDELKRFLQQSSAQR